MIHTATTLPPPPPLPSPRLLPLHSYYYSQRCCLFTALRPPLQSIYLCVVGAVEKDVHARNKRASDIAAMQAAKLRKETERAAANVINRKARVKYARKQVSMKRQGASLENNNAVELLAQVSGPPGMWWRVVSGGWWVEGGRGWRVEGGEW